ncbi:MAG: GvpL/GvpF family gas vesicle protein [Dehalococcoidales bacterium]|nr:GvpL/GvpF family gas vesicle protein [Dehalococcoidales bacterium]
MSYIYAALVLQAMNKEINEANLKKVLAAMNLPEDEAETEALLALMNHSAPKGMEMVKEPSFVPELRRLASQIEAINDRVTAIEQKVAEIKAVEVPGAEPVAFTEEEFTSPAEAIKAIDEARYLYCVADGAEKVSLGRIGIEGNEVYTIPYRDLSAVVHNCPAQPYKSEDEELVKGWIMAHQKVVDAAQQRFGTVLPLGFDTIIKGVEDIDPEENMRKWLNDDYENLKQKIEKLRGKDEYGVQIFWEPKVIADKITRTNEEIKKLDEEMKSKPKGTAYMYKQKLENAIKQEMETLAEGYFRDFYSRIKRHCDDVRLERTKKADGDKQMLMNLSCLLPKDGYEKVGEELEGIQGIEGVSVRFTGPWPPYSFVTPG